MECTPLARTAPAPALAPTLALVLAFTLTLSLLAGCGDGGDAAPSTGITATSIEVPSGLVFDALVAGPPDGDLVLLLHGFPQSSHEWRSQLAALAAAGHRAVAPDLRGYSPRARPAEVEAYRIEALAGDVIDIADRLGARRFHLVGHDWGAAIAWQVALRHPDRLRSLAAVSVPHPAAFAEALATDPDQQQKSTYITFFRQVGVAESVLLADDAAVLRSIYGTGPAAASADEYVRRLSEPGALTAALNYYRAIDLDSAAAEPVTVPTLYVWSTGDTALGRTGAEATARWVDGPYRFVVLEGVSHWVPEDAADALDDLLVEHVRRWR